MNSLDSFPVLGGFVRSGGSIELDHTDSHECAAIAADAQTVWVVLARREGESRLQLLDRLERRLCRCLMHHAPYDELEPPASCARVA